MAELHGWQSDPFGLHEQRYFSQGQPTKLVRDRGREAYDPPPMSEPAMAAATAHTASAPPVPGTIGAPTAPPTFAPPATPSPPSPPVPTVAPAPVGPPESVPTAPPAPAPTPPLPPEHTAAQPAGPDGSLAGTSTFENPMARPSTPQMQPLPPSQSWATPPSPVVRHTRPASRAPLPASPPPQPPPRPGWKRGPDGEWHPPDPHEVGSKNRTPSESNHSTEGADSAQAVTISEAAVYQAAASLGGGAFGRGTRPGRIPSSRPSQPPPHFPNASTRQRVPRWQSSAPEPERPPAATNAFASFDSSAPPASHQPSPELGWWLASDGNWYPPETAPDAAQPLPAPQPSPGPGWWLASDMNWYPPELAPEPGAGAPQDSDPTFPAPEESRSGTEGSTRAPVGPTPAL